MKHILITGANSYIGVSVESWLKQHKNQYTVCTMDMIDGSWKKKDFIPYDVVFHVAGIVHQRETKENVEVYYKVNRDLAIAVAEKAEKAGVKQFILLSSMSVYGKEEGVITKETIEHPQSNYGKSKLQADKKIKKMNSEKFKVIILRPPMIYGKGCKGNYALLSHLARNLPFFPDIRNKRSMLYIDNFCEFVRLLIENEESGIFFPQNETYTDTSQMVKRIAEVRGRKIRLWKTFNPFIKLIGKLPGKLGAMDRKAFGSLVYEKEISKYKENYCLIGFEESIKLSEC